MKETATQTTKTGKAWLAREVRPYRGAVLFLTVLTVVATLLSLAFAYLTQYLVNSARDKDEKLLIVFSVVLFCLIFARILLSALQNYLNERSRARITVGLRNKLFHRLLRADYKSAERYHSGDFLTRLTADVNEVANDTVGLMPAIAGMCVQAVGAVVALLTLDPLFTAVFVAGGLIVMGFTALFRKKTKKYHKEMTETDGENRAFMQESFAASLTLKAYGAEEKAAARSGEILSVYYGKRMKKNLMHTLMGGAFSIVSNSAFIFALVWCGVKILRGSDDYGQIISVMLLLGQLQRPFASFSSILPVVYARAASAERLAETDSLPQDTPVAESTPLDYGALVAFGAEEVTFDYGREKLFSSINARVEKGETVCITGGSGSGKSTLFKLLLGVYTPVGGRVYLQTETEKRSLTTADRELFAYVPQGNFLFTGTIYENLAFFSTETDGEKLREKIDGALRSACAEFVYELPNGLETRLGERGCGLSEGQLQRLAVARALVSERPVLLLDEATSALDSDTEKRLLENIRLKTGKTCLIVTHRPAALEIADRVLHVEDGRIEEK